MAIGQRIKYFRNRKGMTQKQLGEQLGFIVKTSFNLFMVYTMPKRCFWLRISDFRFGKDIIAVSVTGDVKDYVRSCNTSYDRYPTVCGHFDRSVNRVRIVSFNVVCNAFVLFFKAWFVE